MLIAGLVLFALGVVFAAVGFWFRRKLQRVKTWPSADGNVIESKVVRKVSTDDEGNQSEGYDLAVAYQYAVGERTYTGERIALAETTYGSRQAAEERLARYRPGGAVRVKYDPANPASALLEESGAVLVWVFAGIGAAMLVAGMVLLGMS